MKKLIVLLTVLALTDVMLQNCANPGRPTGGPKDTIPPVLIYSYPANGQTNFKDQEIVLEFSEYIKADKLKQELIITPKTEVTYKGIVKRNRLIIKLDEPLPDSITYNFNFADAVVDLTEKNPAVNLSLAFSSGSYIDSMSIGGQVVDLFTEEPGADYLVGLYPVSDTLDFLSINPTYFTTANDSGIFQINYVKQDNYKILSFYDDNRNLLLDPDLEPHGFISGKIRLDSSLQLARPIRTLLQDVKTLKLISIRPTGLHVEAKYNKRVDEYTVADTTLYHTITGENNDIIRFYPPPYLQDSIETTIQAADSLGNIALDTVKFKFIESNRKPKEFQSTVTPDQLYTDENASIRISFNKPVKIYRIDSFHIQADSIYSQTIPTEIQWNDNFTQARITSTFSYDSILTLAREKAREQAPDSLLIDTTLMEKYTRRALTYQVPSATFISVEQDTLSSIEVPFTSKPEPSTGILNINVSTQQPSYTLQLLQDDEVVRQAENQSSITFDELEASSYHIRILIDNNTDGKWSFGNLLKDEEPESIYLYPEETSMRENWIIEVDISF